MTRPPVEPLLRPIFFPHLPASQLVFLSDLFNNRINKKMGNLVRDVILFPPAEGKSKQKPKENNGDRV